MFYHVLIQTQETGEIYELDKQSIEEVVEDIIKPYILNCDFQFNGYFIEPSKVKRLKVTSTERNSEYYVGLESAVMRRSGVFYPISREDCVIYDDKKSNDITRELLKQTKENNLHSNNQGSANSKGNNGKKSDSKNTIFLAYSYREEDDEFVAGFKELLKDKGYNVLDGKADRLGSISEAILEKIRLSDIAVIVMTKRDKKENGKFTTAAWLLEEKGAAIALDKEVAMFVEEEVDEGDIGGLQGDAQRFHFNRNNFLMKVMNFIKILGEKS